LGFATSTERVLDLKGLYQGDWCNTCPQEHDAQEKVYQRGDSFRGDPDEKTSAAV